MSYLGREIRHSPCLMTPLTFVGLLVVAVLWLFAFAWKFPTLLLGYLMSPLVNRAQFLVEFLYPLSIGRWVHLTLTRIMQRSHRGNKADKNQGFHARCVEARIEIIPRRLYLHVLPQFLDNLGYLLVLTPPETTSTPTTTASMSPLGRIASSTADAGSTPVVALMVDCGDSASVFRSLQLIQETHYPDHELHVQSLLSTHKHHDHTAGNLDLLRHRVYGPHLKIVVGGAVERVPGCNYPVKNGDKIPLPKHGASDMGTFVELEAIATPAHTRGSITYALRLLPPYDATTAGALGFLFTGDTMFSGGGGVPFEADIEKVNESTEAKQTFKNLIKATSSFYAVERCFADILARAVPSSVDHFPADAANRLFVLPGHEYTQELVSRQFGPPNKNSGDNQTRWKNLAPSVFFETASQLYVALHRKGLPSSSGRLLTAVASPIQRELHVNPHFRNLRKKGEIVVQAIEMWNKHFARASVGYNYPQAPYQNGKAAPVRRPLGVAKSTEEQWNLDIQDLNKPIFTTVYATDLDNIIRDVQKGELTGGSEILRRLREMKHRMNERMITRRPIPNALPADRVVFKGLLGLVLLGSAPTSLTFSDSEKMNLPPPILRSSEVIPVSRTHLISVLHWLGILADADDGGRVVAMIHQLWREALEDAGHSLELNVNNGANGNYNSVDHEVLNDIVELGDLKYTLYGIPRKQSSSSLFCLPCSREPRTASEHPVYKSRMKPQTGEVVRHDIMKCPICRTQAGCPHFSGGRDVKKPVGDEFEVPVHEALPYDSEQPSARVMASIGSMAEDDGEGIFVEVTSMVPDL